MRFAANCAGPAPGTRVLHESVHAGDVVDSCCITERGSGPACEVLGVISLDQAACALDLDGIADSTLTRLNLPYGLIAP